MIETARRETGTEIGETETNAAGENITIQHLARMSMSSEANVTLPAQAYLRWLRLDFRDVILMLAAAMASYWSYRCCQHHVSGTRCSRQLIIGRACNELVAVVLPPLGFFFAFFAFFDRTVGKLKQKFWSLF